MELIATRRRKGVGAVAYAYGAALIDGGRTLRCGLLFVQRGTARTLTFQDPQTKNTYRVRLPDSLTRQARHARVSRFTLEVLR